jgi:single-strand DNA-binding protein
MYQKVVIVGNLGGAPELRYTPNGDAVTSFSVATNRKWGGNSPGEEVVWFRVSAWGAQAEACNKYLSKGKQVLVEGRLTPDKETGGPRVWTDNSGNPRASFELRAITVQFLGGGGSSPGGDTTSREDQVSEDQIPF